MEYRKYEKAKWVKEVKYWHENIKKTKEKRLSEWEKKGIEEAE